jgi:hypothetical protein
MGWQVGTAFLPLLAVLYLTFDPVQSYRWHPFRSTPRDLRRISPCVEFLAVNFSDMTGTDISAGSSYPCSLNLSTDCLSSQLVSRNSLGYYSGLCGTHQIRPRIKLSLLSPASIFVTKRTSIVRSCLALSSNANHKLAIARYPVAPALEVYVHILSYTF